MPFDPSTAKGFDPGSAKPQAPGIGPASPRAQALKETITGNGVGEQQAFGNQQDIEKQLRAAGKSDEEIQNDPAWQASARNLNRGVMAAGSGTAIGEAGGGVLGGVLGPLAAKAGPVVSRLLPGATHRAEDAIKSLGPSLDKDEIGRGVLTALRPDYEALHAERGKLLAHVAGTDLEEAEKTAAFRKVYQDPKFAELKKIEDNPLGAKVIATTNRYSSVPKINPKDFLRQAFRSPQDVRDLRSLFNGDQAAVEKVATRYVSSDLKSVLENAKASGVGNANPLKSEAGNIAGALEKWRQKNADWLKQVPETKKAVDAFIDNMADVARTQKQFKIASGAAATLGLSEAGFHPMRLLGRIFGGGE